MTLKEKIRLAAVLALLGLFALAVQRANGTASPPDTLRPIYVVNHSQVISDAAVVAALPDFQAALSQDFAPVWHTDAQLVFVAAAPPKSWRITISDDGGYCFCYGYHGFHGAPYAKVFVIDQTPDWQVTFSHELFEMMADPNVGRREQIGNSGHFYALEVADPPEDSQFAYKRGSTLISDFVTEAWFSNGYGPYDFLGHIKRPLQILKGGYIAVWRDGHWHWRSHGPGRLGRLPVDGVARFMRRSAN